jgi:hypothetical protein
VIVSFMQLRLTQTHTKSCANEFWKEDPEVWEEYVKDMARLWNEYNAYWYDVAKKGEVPVYLFRFEDLIQDPKTVLTDIFELLLDKESLEGTYVEKRIE